MDWVPLYRYSVMEFTILMEFGIKKCDVIVLMRQRVLS